MINMVYNDFEVISVMETSKLLLEIKKLNDEELMDFHEKYTEFIAHKLKERKGHPVGSSYDFWLEDEDLYDDLVE